MVCSTFHNHSTFCDGKSTVEEMVLAAIEAGQATIGFSGHSHIWFDESYCMSLEGTASYRAEVARVRDKYADRVRVLCGVEQDYFSEMPTDGYDFVIGSVHYVRVAADGSTAAPDVHAMPPAQVEAACARASKDAAQVATPAPVGIPGEDGAVYLDVDNTEEAFCAAVDQYFGGDAIAFCQAYFAQVADVRRKTGCTFVGHFDLVTKFNEADCLFDTTDLRYRAAALSAVRALCASWNADAACEDASRGGGDASAVDYMEADGVPSGPIGSQEAAPPAGGLFEVNTGAMAKGYRETPYPAPFILEELRTRGASVILSADCHDATKLQYALDDSLACGCRIVREL